MEIVTGLRRLGFIDKPAKGDHVRLFKKVEDHPGGKLTIQTGIDGKHCGKSDVDRVQRDTKLLGDMWSRMMAKKMKQSEYDDHLRAIPKADLVNQFWRPLVEEETAAAAEPDAPKPGRPGRPRKPARQTK